MHDEHYRLQAAHCALRDRYAMDEHKTAHSQIQRPDFVVVGLFVVAIGTADVGHTCCMFVLEIGAEHRDSGEDDCEFEHSIEGGFERKQSMMRLIQMPKDVPDRRVMRARPRVE